MNTSLTAPFGALPPLRPGFIRLLLVRHGESLGNARKVLDNRVESDIDVLTETGRAQAASLGVALRDSCLLPGEDLVCVGSSTMHRAVETAAIIAKEAFANAALMQPSADLVEIRNGNLDGRLIHEVMDELKATSSAWENGELDVRVGETGDSPKMLQERAICGLSSLLSDLPAGTSIALIVAHFWLNRTLLALWMGKNLSKLGEIEQPNAGLNVVDVAASDVRNADVHLVGWQPPVLDAGHMHTSPTPDE